MKIVEDINIIIENIKKGGIVAIPTDTVKSLFRTQGINEKFHLSKNKKESK